MAEHFQDPGPQFAQDDPLPGYAAEVAEEEAKEARLIWMQVPALAALSSLINKFPNIPPDQLQEELCDALAGDDVLDTAKRWAR